MNLMFKETKASEGPREDRSVQTGRLRLLAEHSLLTAAEPKPVR